jgi:acyl-CoA reductase-like NAD-dependent aldehyde dehydrogenase
MSRRIACCARNINLQNAEEIHMKTELHPGIQEFLSQPNANQFGAQSRMTATEQVINPSDGSVLAEVAMGGAEEIELAIVAGEKAFPAWSAMRPSDRALLLIRFAEVLEKHSAELAQLESLDVGKPIAAAEGFDIPFGIECFRYFADLSIRAHYSRPLDVKGFEARTWRAPYGVCGFIFPWNFPFTLLCWGIAPALAAGNTVVVKPSGVTPLSTLYAAQLAVEAGLPPGVFNVVAGVGSGAGVALSSHPRIKRISFTGSPEVGRKIAELSGRNLVPCKLELGGKGAAVVFEDVDVDSVAMQLAAAVTMNTGQVCCTATRWLIHEKIYDRFAGKVTEALQQVKIGSGLNRDTQMGPLVSSSHRQRVLDYLDRGLQSGARAILEGGAVSPRGEENGFYVTPALLEGPDNNVCCREEIFGPCAYLLRFKGEDSAIAKVNELAYGLANSVWSADLTRANRVAEHLVAGNNWINAHNLFAYGLPYGGVNISGMGGGVNSPETFYDYLRTQTIARPVI